MEKNTDQTKNLPEKHPASPPQGYYVPYPPYPEEDEINLLDLLIVMLKRKFLIMGMVCLAGIGAVIVSLLMTNIYRSQATIIPRQ